MRWFRRTPEVLDAEHLLRETAQADSMAADPDAASMGGAEPDGTGATTTGAVSGGFRLTVAAVFVIRNRGTVVAGQVDAGSISAGSEVAVTRNGQVLRRTKVAGVEMFRKTLNIAVAGQNVGLLLDGVSRVDVAAGDVLTA